MIIKHKQNQFKKFERLSAIEVDLRLSVKTDEAPAVPIIGNSYENAVQPFLVGNYVDCKAVFLNVRTDGAEELIVEKVKREMIEYYFVNSSINRIVEMVKFDKTVADRFVIRISDMEPFNEELMNLVKPKYVMFDWFGFENWDKEKFEGFVKDTEAKLKPYTTELIVVSPEVHISDGSDYLAVKKIISKYFKKFSVLTKSINNWK